MHSQTRNVIGVSVLVALAAVTWLFSRPATEDAARQRVAEDSNPGYYLRNATLFGTDADGRIYYRMIADRIEQSVAGDELLLHGLRVEYEPEFEVNWTLSARKGRAERGDDVLNLSDGVLLTNTAAPEGRATVIETPSLTLDTARSMATTADAVVVSHGRTTFRATGLTADLARDQLELHSNVSAYVAR